MCQLIASTRGLKRFVYGHMWIGTIWCYSEMLRSLVGSAKGSFETLFMMPYKNGTLQENMAPSSQLKVAKRLRISASLFSMYQEGFGMTDLHRVLPFSIEKITLHDTFLHRVNVLEKRIQKAISARRYYG